MYKCILYNPGRTLPPKKLATNKPLASVHTFQVKKNKATDRNIWKSTVDRNLDADWSSNDIQIGLDFCLPMVIGGACRAGEVQAVL